MMYSVSSELYEEVVSRLKEAIGGGSYFSGSILFEWEGIECRLTATLIVYRRQERYPEGDRERLSDLVPVWWEFHTTGPGGEFLNDFTFSEVRARI